MARPHAAVILFALLLAMLLLPAVRAATFVVSQEWAVTGTTTGISGAQTDDGLYETLTEADAAPDPTTYPVTQTITTGFQISGTFPTDIQTSDNVYVQYREAPTGSSTVISNNPGTVGACNFVPGPGDNGRLSDNLYAATTGMNEACVYSSFGFAVPSGASITKVELGYESFTSGNDRWTLSLSWDGGTNWCAGVLSPTLSGADPNAYAYQDFTTCRAWTAADVNTVASRFTHSKVAATDTNSLDANVVRVTWVPPGAYRMEVRYDWTGVPSGQAQTLSVKGHISDENILVQVLTPPATWNTRLTLNSIADQTLTYVLTASEYNAGSPAVRFIDALGADAVPSDLLLDQVKITTTIIDYRLDVHQNITGIVGISPILQIKGRIPSGGENFNVYAWNFTSAVWDLRMASPFSALNLYHNVNLPPQDISGGTVMVRYVDTISSDTVQDILQLDVVEVSTSPGNSPPGLSNDGVAPTTGNISTTFTFFVRYTDVDNDAPQYVRLQLNAVLYAMVENNSADTIYSDGKDYHYTLVIGTRGTFNYNFTTQAVTGDTSIVTSPTRQVSVLNRPPVVTNPIAMDTVHTGRRYARGSNATDPDGDILTWSLVTNASWLFIGPSNGTVWGRAPKAPAAYYANVSVSDGFGGTARFNYTLSVTNANPSITNPITSDTAFRSSPYSRSFTASDPDGDTVTWSLVTNASSLAIGPSNGTVYGRTTAGVASYYVNATVNDGFGGAAFVNYTLMVVDRRPVITNPVASQFQHGRFYWRDFNATDLDGDPLTWSLTTNATWLTLGALNGTLWGSRPLGNHTYYVNVTVGDPYGAKDYDNYTLTTGNRAPSVLGSGNDVVHLGAFYRRTLLASDPDGDPLTWSLNTNATWLRIGSGNGTLYGRAPITLASYYVNASVDDGLGGRGFRNFTLLLGNSPPLITSSVANATVFRVAFSRNMTAMDPDGDPLTWSLTTNASTVTIDPSTGVLRSSATLPPGPFYIHVTVRDGYGGIASANFTLTFVNRAPVMSGIPIGVGVEGTEYTSSFTATDPDGDPLGWSLRSNATWLSVDGSGLVRGSAFPGRFFVNVTVRDPYGGVASMNYTLVIHPVIITSGFDWFLPALFFGVLGAIIGATTLFLVHRRPKGDIILKAFMFSSKGILMQELASTQEDPNVKFLDILKLLPTGHLDGDHWIELPPYNVAVVQVGTLHLAAVTRIKRRNLVIEEAKKVLTDLLGDEDVKVETPAPPVQQ